MKQSLPLTFFIICCCLSGYAQIVQRATVGSGGSSQSVVVNDKKYFVSQSIGQASVIGTSYSGNYAIRQGYQQPPASGNTNNSTTAFSLVARVYPNPFDQNITVTFEEIPDKPIRIVIHDLSGKVRHTMDAGPVKLIELPLQGLPDGQYLISISSGQKRATSSIIKL